MSIRRLTTVIARAVAAAAALSGAAATAAPAATAFPSSSGIPGSQAACPPARAGHLRCLAVYQTRPRAGQAGPPAAPAAPTPSGWGARAVQDAYKLPAGQGSGQTVAIVDAYNTPGLAASLSTYRAQYALPPCTISSGCLRKVNQEGEASPLPASAVPHGWDVETSLDADMVSAACPRCKILVVEANDNSDAALAAAENTAASLGAQVISNSFGGREDGYAMTLSKAFDHPGHTIVVASGDYGFTAANSPADLTTVTAVGGTQLTRAAVSRGWRETVWNHDFGASGSGCSAYVTKPPWQSDKTCPMRTIADVSAVAWDLAVYDKARRGWLKVGGTSAAAPLIAGVYALAGNATTIKPGYPYRHRRSLFDITTGNNDPLNRRPGAICGSTYMCMAKTGYDAPTGLGTPHGARSF